MDLFDPFSEKNWILRAATLANQPDHAARMAKRVIAPEIEEEFDFASREYCELFERSDATAFQHPTWLNGIARHLTGKHAKLAALVVRNATDRRLALAMPIMLKRYGPLSVVDAADLEVGDYNAIVTDLDPERLRAAFRSLPELTFVRIRKVRNEAGSCTAWLPGHKTSMGFNAHELHLANCDSDWRSRVLEPSFARYLRSKRKRLAAKGSIRFTELSGAKEIRDAFVALRDFRKTRFARDVLCDPAHFEFYVDMALQGPVSGLARTYMMTVGEEPISVLFGLAHRQRFSFLLLGFDNARFRNMSGGLLMLEAAINESIVRGDKVFDLTIGDENYKHQFATTRVPMVTLWLGNAPWPWIGEAVARCRSPIQLCRQTLNQLVRKAA